MEAVYQIFMALAGLGVLLYGIRVMNSSMESVLSNRFKRALGKASGSVFKSYGLGMGTTFLLQTSVLTITMTVGLINIGAIGLAQAFVLVLGANFGATCSMVLLMFESISLLKILSIFCIVGVLIGIFAKQDKVKRVGSMMLGFGLLCLGITLLSSSMRSLVDSTDISNTLSLINNPILLVLIGVVISVLMQGSYPVTAILIAFVSAGAMGFESACFALWGANLGTGISLLFLTGFGGGHNGRRVVLFNILLKIFACILFTALMFIPDWANWIHWTLSGGVASISLIVMALLFNFVPGLLLLPFIKPLATFMEKIVKQRNKKSDNYASFELDEKIINNPAIAHKSVRDNIAKILSMEVELSKKLCSIMFEKEVSYTSQKGKIRALEKAIKLTTNSTIRIGAQYSQSNLEKINILLNILNDTAQILKVCIRFDDYAQSSASKSRKLLVSQIEILKPLSENINELGSQVGSILNNELTQEEREETLKNIFKMNDANIAQNTKAKHNLTVRTVEGRSRDNALYFNLLYEFAKLGTDYTDIAIKITLMEE